MKKQEIIDFNRVNLDKINERDWDQFCYLSGLECTDTDYLFIIKDTHKKYSKNKYICSMYLFDKETNSCIGVAQFGFTYFNRLQRMTKGIQDAAAAIIAEVKHD